MPGWQAALGNDGVRDMAEYVMSLSGRRVDADAAVRGKEKYATFCVACHGADGKGNIAMGAPNLTDGIWLYGSSVDAIRKTIAEGRNGNMPAHKDFLGADKAHLVAAYVYSLSNGKAQSK
jgi:cytochrome c oxidase cbb3-type subunit 3